MAKMKFSDNSAYNTLKARGEALGFPGFAEALEQFNYDNEIGLDLERNEGLSAAFWTLKHDANGNPHFEQVFRTNVFEGNGRTNIISGVSKVSTEAELQTKKFLNAATGANEAEGEELYVFKPGSQTPLKLTYDAATRRFSTADPYANMQAPIDSNTLKPNIFQRFIRFFNKNAFQEKFQAWEEAVTREIAYNDLQAQKAAFTEAFGADKLTNEKRFQEAASWKQHENNARNATGLENTQEGLEKMMDEQDDIREVTQKEKTVEELKQQKALEKARKDRISEGINRGFKGLQDYYLTTEERLFVNPHEYILIDGVRLTELLKKKLLWEGDPKDIVKPLHNETKDLICSYAAQGCQVELYAPDKNNKLPKNPLVFQINGKDDPGQFVPAPEDYLDDPGAGAVHEQGNPQRPTPRQIYNIRKASMVEMQKTVDAHDREANPTMYENLELENARNAQRHNAAPARGGMHF